MKKQRRKRIIIVRMGDKRFSAKKNERRENKAKHTHTHK